MKINDLKRWCLLAFFLCQVPDSIAEEVTEDEEDLMDVEKSEEELPECGLYLAVSSTSTAEEPKWGVFAGSTIPKLGQVGYGEVAIQTFHLAANSMMEGNQPMDSNPLLDVVDFLEQYIWVPHSSGGQFELSGAGKTVTAIPGVGVFGGWNPKMTNADFNHSLAYHRPAWGEKAGVSHPGRGASSAYFEVSISALEVIPQGMEIFINYGDNWENEDDEDDGEGSDQITVEDHPKIDETISKMIEFFDKHETALDAHTKQEIYNFLKVDVMMAAAGSKKGRIISNMLPESPDDLKQVQAQGGSLKLTNPRTLRTLPWLAKHGRCMDNIRPGPSTIPHAGRGAFATRRLPKDAIIAPMPLIQIANAGIFDMHPLKVQNSADNGDYYVRKRGSNPNDVQLMLNYCLGHPDSDLLFLPVGASTSFINHSPEPNAKLVWSDHPNNHKHWFDLPPYTLQEDGNRHLGLMMEVVATKDIQEGEEVTIDYGPEWSAAWKDYVAKWESSTQNGAPWPIRSLDYNNMFKDKPYPLVREEYPENLMIKCFLLVKKPTDEPPLNDVGEKVRQWTDIGKTIHSENLFDCKLTDVQEITTPEGLQSWNYTIFWQGKTESTWVKHVPHKAIIFVDKPETSDQHIPNAFRHYIGIPDEIFPEGPWRNSYDESREDDDGLEEDYD